MMPQTGDEAQIEQEVEEILGEAIAGEGATIGDNPDDVGDDEEQLDPQE